VQSRRSFLLGTGALLVGCRRAEAPVFVDTSIRGVERVVPAFTKLEGAGVEVHRAIGTELLRNLDPFVMLDRFGSADPARYVRGFPDHPHRGFETVTVMLEGRVRHADSRGNKGVITGGGAQWMTAGRGIVHSEMPDQTEGELAGYQLWINLPAKEKLCPQHYQDLAPERLAEGAVGGGKVRVVAGEVHGLRGPTRPCPTEPLLATVALADDTVFEVDVPEGHAAFVFVHEGSVAVGPENGSTTVQGGHLAILGGGKRARLRARDERSALLLAAGKPLHEPIVQRGPFVMNTDAEIQKAFADYRAGVLDR